MKAMMKSHSREKREIRTDQIINRTIERSIRSCQSERHVVKFQNIWDRKNILTSREKGRSH